MNHDIVTAGLNGINLLHVVSWTLGSSSTVIELTTGDAVILTGEDNEAFKHFVETSTGAFRNLTKVYQNYQRVKAA